MARLELPAFDETRGVFTAQMARDGRYTRSALAAAVTAGRIVRLHRGVYVRAECWAAAVGPEADRARFAARSVAATLATRGSAASHASCAVLAELPLWRVPMRACVTVEPTYTGDASHAHLHRARLAGVTTSGGVVRTSVARSVLDLAREHSIEDAVVVGDAAIARGTIDEQSLMRNARFCSGWPGFRRAARVLTLLDGRSESPIESVSRLRLAEVDLPAAEPQVWIYTTAGVRLGRLDFYWDELGVGGEVDGRAKYGADPNRVWWREKKRQEAMEDLGLFFVRWGKYELDHPLELRDKVLTVFRRAAQRLSIDRRWVPASSGDRFAPLRHADRAS